MEQNFHSDLDLNLNVTLTFTSIFCSELQTRGGMTVQELERNFHSMALDREVGNLNKNLTEQFIVDHHSEFVDFSSNRTKLKNVLFMTHKGFLLVC